MKSARFAVMLLLVGAIIGATITWGTILASDAAHRRALVNLARTFVEAEYAGDVDTVLALATHPITEDIRAFRFPDLEIESGVSIEDSYLVQLCNDRATVTLKVQPLDDSRYFWEHVDLQQTEDSSWRVRGTGRDR